MFNALCSHFRLMPKSRVLFFRSFIAIAIAIDFVVVAVFAGYHVAVAVVVFGW